MRKKRLSRIVFIVFVLLSGCGRDGPLLLDTPINTIAKRLDQTIPGLMKDSNVAGLSIVVIREAKVVISKSFGYADIETGRKLDAQTVFRAASLGKPIFSYLVAVLARQGQIDLDVPLVTYLKEEVVKGDQRSRAITARMVLSHTTGLPNLDGKGSDVVFEFDPGTDFQYSGHAYLYLQKVIEKITGKALNELADELVFQPLNMAHSSYQWKDAYRGQLSSSYDNEGKAFGSKESPMQGYSAWSLFTTIDDYARFVVFMLETADTQHSIANKMLKPQVDVANNVQWGLGWGLQETQPNPSFWHWGSMAGFRHYVVGYPVEDTAVIVMTNSWRAFQMVDDVMVAALGGSYPSYDWF
jgi:CubicO group peptidase (beta-lactamase class C family)